MQQRDIGDEVIDCLRMIAFAGSDREILLEAPLGESGLGLDSLALVEFFTELEDRFGFDVFESEWFESGDQTLHSLIEYLRGASQNRDDDEDVPAPSRS